MDGTMVTTAAPAKSLAITSLTFGEGVLYAILGMIVVFFALVLLMVIIKILFAATDKKKAQPALEAAAPAESLPEPVKRDDPAPGSAGEIKLYTTDPKDAAMIMAIVAETLGKPLNELRFKSIREIKG